MDTSISEIVTTMIGTLAVILVVAAFIGGSQIIKKYQYSNNRNSKIKLAVVGGVLGGVFGIYGNLAGVDLLGALISVRDIGPMLAGFVGGPAAGLLGGLICGAHRLFIGGLTAKACIVATCCIGVICGFLFRNRNERMIKPQLAFVTGVLMEMMHLIILLIMVKPFIEAFTIVRVIAVPFILVNAIGFTLMISIMVFLEKQWTVNQERNRMMSELSVAENIQRSILPTINDSFPGRPELSIEAFMEAAKEVGGDFYDVFYVDRDKIAFLIADVSGKGIPAALFMMQSKQILQDCVKEFDELSDAITEANDRLCQGNEAEMFVTAWIGVLDLLTGEVDYVNAGHNPPVVSLGGEVSYMKERGGLVLAGMEGIPYRQGSFVMRPDDIILLYTDGVTEAENEKLEQFGEEALQKWVETLGNVSSQEIVEYVRKRVKEHVAGYEQSDDITMLCVKFTNKEAEGDNAVKRYFEVDSETTQRVTEFAENELTEMGISMKHIYSFNIAVDELLSNVCKYSGATNIKVSIMPADNAISMRFEDNGKPFDPDSAPEPDIEASAEDRKIGGLGLFMVKNMMDDFKYEYKDGYNISLITKNLEEKPDE